MAYLILARKYRPIVFDELIGQEPVTETLQNSIDSRKIAQAFIFSGPMGIGKTSAARIFSKALNCEEGLSSVPCNKCSNCQEIANGSSLDVLEIDGASSRGIDEIRSIRENAKYAPSKSRYKIYIIDEVHMLTKEAFNALLKTLEEPPSHVIFIFATTEVNKIPNTIRSRCQYFSFRRISQKLIVQRLKKIVELEELACDEEALYLIAKSANGSLRDSQSILDQVISFCGKEIDAGKVREVLGVRNDELYFGLLRNIFLSETAGLLTDSAQLVESGAELRLVLLALVNFIHTILLAKNNVDSELFEIVPEKLKELTSVAENVSQEKLIKIQTEMIRTYKVMKNTTIPQVEFELLMIKITQEGFFASREELFARILSLKEQLDGLGNNVVNVQTPPEDKKKTVDENCPFDRSDFWTDGNLQKETWDKIIELLIESDRIIGAAYLKGFPKFTPEGIVIEYSNSEHDLFTVASDEKNREKLKNVIIKLYGKVFEINVIRSQLDLVDEGEAEKEKIINFAKSIFKGKEVGA